MNWKELIIHLALIVIALVVVEAIISAATVEETTTSGDKAVTKRVLKSKA